MCLQVTAHVELASSRGTEVRSPRRLQLSRAVTALSRSHSTCVAPLPDRANASIYSSDRRPDALRARGTHPALKMSSQVLPPLSRLSTACRIWQHWQDVGCKERSPSREAASQRQAPALNATYQVSLEVLPPASRLPAQSFPICGLVAVCAVTNRPWPDGGFSTEIHPAVDGGRPRPPPSALHCGRRELRREAIRLRRNKSGRHDRMTRGPASLSKSRSGGPLTRQRDIIFV